ncbi:MAG TPA: bifunctional phosphoribosylaminoimidazolecarboxamide formyltransferase/IMP cyclohydrolase, partial [Gemmatimonadaceae bacterium]|nr:bifunctional phosphoribosylaminoimidazolecarboxamide formyltransferase/IMP cyclohydrolase [Gemmatimonadaceae bacterium]
MSDKTGLTDFARQLTDLGWSLVSTGGTARALREAGLTVRDISDLTGFPEMLDGRVKTLHPVVHGGLLARRDLPEHMQALAAHNIAPIGMVVVNLYPFRETAAKRGIKPHDVIEQIDIGGPSMLRSAAKNAESVFAVVDPHDYEAVVGALRGDGDAAALRRTLAKKVFEHTAAYDAAIATWFAQQDGDRFPDRMTLAFERAQGLRYGENPGQQAAFYVEKRGAGIGALEQLGGKELSFNNIFDLEGALLATDPFAGEPACAIIKHTTPCGLGVGASAAEAYKKALACDPVSAFGSVIAFTVPVDEVAAAAVANLFVECVVAPDFSAKALETLTAKKNLRVLRGKAPADAGSLDFKRVRGGLLVQDRPPASLHDADWKVVTKRVPTDAERSDLL